MQTDNRNRLQNREDSVQPVLTITIPCYNVEDTLERCLDSFADARFNERLQVLIINDGSTDRTAEIGAEYVREYPRIFRMISQPNAGHGGAVMTGIRHAEGVYFRILDGDDRADPDALERLLEVLENCRADLVVDVKREVYAGSGTEKVFPIPDDIKRHHRYRFSEVCLQGDITSYMMIHTMSVRTDRISNGRVALPEHVFYEDYEYITKAALQCRTVQFEEINVYYYSVGREQQSVSAVNYVKRYGDHNHVLMDLLHYVDTCGVRGRRLRYLQKNILLLINTQMNIALIFDPDRKRGRKRCRELRGELRTNWPYYNRASMKRYLAALVLHFAGFDQQKLNRLMGRQR